MSLLDRIKAARRVYLIGNGGSYSNAAHIANDLLASGIKAYTMDSAILTAFANDHGYEHVFANWLGVVGEKGDLLIALSGSGKSPNILNAIQMAETLGMDVERVFGAPVHDMQTSEERQIMLGHELMRQLKKELKENDCR